MITDPDGVEWGTAAQIASRLQGGVTPSMVRQWARWYGLPKARMADGNGRPQVRYPVSDAAEIDRRMRHSKRGRKRALDTKPVSLHTAGKHNSARSTACPAH